MNRIGVSNFDMLALSFVLELPSLGQNRIYSFLSERKGVQTYKIVSANFKPRKHRGDKTVFSLVGLLAIDSPK